MGFVPFRCASLYFWSVKLSHPFFWATNNPSNTGLLLLLFSWSQRLNNLYTNSSRNSSYATIHTVTRDWGEKEKRRSITATPITVRASSSSSSPLVGFSRRSSPSSSSLHCEPVISSRQHLSISLSRQSTTQFIIVAHSLTSTPTPTPRRSSIPV